MAGVLASPVKRCPPGLNCGVGPECTIYDCSTENCASAPVCQKRDLDFVKPCAEICNAEGVCVCADKVKRDPTPVVDRPCPDICNEEGVCGCALQSSLAKVKRNPTPTLDRPCPDICNEEGVCGCALESLLAKVERDPTPVNHPCPEICNEQGVCGCALETATAKA